MHINQIDKRVTVSGQVNPDDVAELAKQGIQVLVCNRPDNEASDQPSAKQIKLAADSASIDFVELPFGATGPTSEQVEEFAKLLESNQRIHAYCRTGNRSSKLYDAALASKQDIGSTEHNLRFDVVIIGAGSAGIATAASIRKRTHDISIGIIDPSEDHYYQPGWTLVGGGEFTAESTKRKTANIIPKGCKWIKGAVKSFSPNQNSVTLEDNSSVVYEQLVVAPGLKLNWEGIEGLSETLGKNGVTSNYRFDLAPYTWELVQNLNGGKALFTQPPMPIKCAGAPQKAMYLSASEWLRKGRLNNINIEFHNSGGVLFGVQDYVPALMEYIEKYNVDLNFNSTLFKINGQSKTAYFKDANGNLTEKQFDMIHVCPPQIAPDFIRSSELADEAGWLDVDQHTLRSTKYDNIWGVGDVMNTPNAKTMAAARKQAPTVAHNIVSSLLNEASFAKYDGYGSCPLTVEHGKIVLAEFGYGGKLLPTFPTWFNDGTKPTHFAWYLKAKMLQPIYWHGMLKGREWLASPVY